MMKSYIWLQTSDGSLQQVEQEVAVFCPWICHEIHSGMGSSKTYPISLPSRGSPAMLSLILDYCRFHQVPGRSNKVCKFDGQEQKSNVRRVLIAIHPDIIWVFLPVENYEQDLIWSGVKLFQEF